MSQLAKQHVIGVVITFSRGLPKYSYTSALGNDDAPEHLHMAPGDEVAWTVMQRDPDGKISYPPYKLTFSDASILGTASLSVPAGGFSPFRHARSLFRSTTKYTLTVTGLNPPSDPTIVIDPDPGQIFKKAASFAYQILWDFNPEDAPQWSDGNGELNNFPMPVLNPGDTVQFETTTAQPFVINLDPTVAPLFDGETSSFTIPSDAVGPQTVIANSDVNSIFCFADAADADTQSPPQTLTFS